MKPVDDDVPGAPRREIDDPTDGGIGADRRPGRGRRRDWAVVVVGVVVFCALPTLALLGFNAVIDPSEPSAERMDTLLAEAPPGTVVVSEDVRCASAECWRIVRLAPPPGQTITDVLNAIDVPFGPPECGPTSWWNWRRTCVGARTSGDFTGVRDDPDAAAVFVVMTQRAVGD